jgi:hypothetical protein
LAHLQFLSTSPTEEEKKEYIQANVADLAISAYLFKVGKLPGWLGVACMFLRDYGQNCSPQMISEPPTLRLLI